MAGERLRDRQVLAVTGADRARFLQGLVTNDVNKLGAGGLVYAALLTPQGKYLADFFLLQQGDAIWIDVKADLAADLVRRLTLYRLRADVAIAPAAVTVLAGFGPAPDGALTDPRDVRMGWRMYLPDGAEFPSTPIAAPDRDARRVAACVPETGLELIPGETFVLEAGFDRLSGVDHRKGCYVGQEVTARMKHKTELRKGLAVVRVTGLAAPGTPIESADGRAAGTLHTVAGGQAIAYLRFDRAGPGMRAGEAVVDWDGHLPETAASA